MITLLRLIPVSCFVMKFVHKPEYLSESSCLKRKLRV